MKLLSHGLLCHRLLYSGDEYLEAFLRFKSQLKYVAGDEYEKSESATDDEHSEYWRVLYTICLYHEAFNTLPKATGLRDFLKTSSDSDISSAWSPTLQEAIKEIRDLDETELKSLVDPLVLVKETIEYARELHHRFALRRGMDALQGGAVSQSADSKTKLPSGIDDSRVEMQRLFAKDARLYTDEHPEGVWQENTEAVAERINEYLSGKQTRVFSGFKSMDGRFVMRLGKTLVIAGNSGDGKSLLLNSMLYNMASNGEQILYNSLEFTEVEIWETFTFLYQRDHQREFPMPPKYRFQEYDPDTNPSVTQTDIDNFYRLQEEIRTNCPLGKIDVVRKWTMPEFRAYYETHNPERKYTVVVVDYLAHMSLEKDKPPRTEAEKQTAVDVLSAEVVNWTHQVNQFLFITPAQIGKGAAVEAKKRWEGREDDSEEECGYTLDSLYYGSALKQDGDLIISVFSPEELKMKQNPEMMVKCNKHRLTKSFGTIRLGVDPEYDYVYDANDAQRYDLGQPSAPATPATTTSIDVDAIDPEFVRPVSV